MSKKNDGALSIEYVSVDALVPYARNAKEHDERQVDDIANSMLRFGMCDPIAVWTNPDGALEIVEGHGRVLALKKLNIDTAPIIKLDHLTDEERRAYTHVHNQTTLSSGFDESVLLEDLNDLDFDWEDFGFDLIRDEEDENGKSVSIDRTLGVFIECVDESEQQRIFEELLERGLNCRILTL